MKNLFSILILSLFCVSCGLSEEERAAQQAENQEKLNVIIEDLRSKADKGEQESGADTITTDSVETDSI